MLSSYKIFNIIYFPSSFQNVFKSLAEPNRTKLYKLERGLNKNLESFPSAMLPKLWNARKKLNLQIY